MFLQNDAQHLFRRAQTRQVLVYLRDDEPARYIRNVTALLASDKIRPHLKLLIAELLAAFPDPREEEWNALSPAIESEIEAIREGKSNPNKMGSRIFDVFRASRSLFVVADRSGAVERWIKV